MYLNLEGNPLTGQFAQEHTINGRAEFDGVQSLALTLSQNHIDVPQFTKNRLGKKVETPSQKHCQQITNLVYLDVGSNSLGTKELEEIANSLERNNNLLAGEEKFQGNGARNSSGRTKNENESKKRRGRKRKRMSGWKSRDRKELPKESQQLS